MRVVVVGDLAFKGRYHLGDEAMSEVALQQLRSRGADVTFIAGDPAVTRAFYEVDAVARFGFGSIRSREDQDRHLEAVLAAARGEAEAPDGTADTIAAVRESDAVVIAGGGNLNSVGIHHIYERLAVKRVAERFGIPLYVTSQTVGPHLREGERGLVAEIARYARVFGVRERNSAGLMRALCGDDAHIVHTLDDAILLEPAPLEADLGLPGRYAVASFTFHARTTGMHEDDYYRELAAILDGIVEGLDIDIVLLPHMSTFAVPNPLGADDDGYGHDRIVRYSRSSRLHAAPLLPARQLLTVTAAAEFSVSTRYHPLIFGAALGVPAIGIVTSYYSAVRMRGALANAGMESFAIPFEYWRPVLGAPLVASLRDRLAEFAAHIRRAGGEQLDYQRRWWDAIHSSIAGDGDVLSEDCVPSPPVEWADPRTGELLAVARVAQESTNLDRLNALMDAEDLRRRERETARRLRDLETQRDEQQRELAELRHRTRPPGAALRDRVRLKLREIRGNEAR